MKKLYLIIKRYYFNLYFWQSLVLFFFCVSGFVFATGVKQQKMNENNTKGTIDHSTANSAKIEQKTDDVKELYLHLANRVVELERIVKNYQADSDLVLDKANHMVSLWLNIGTGFVMVVIGLSIWNNYKQENSYKESVNKLNGEIKKIQNEQEIATRINRIGSVLTCLNSLPDPLLTGTNAERRNYVNYHLSLIYDEFSAFVELVKADNTIFQDMRHLQLVLLTLKISILQAQCVYSDIKSGLAFYTFSNVLDNSVNNIRSSKITPTNLIETLFCIRDEFEIFRNDLPK